MLKDIIFFPQLKDTYGVNDNSCEDLIQSFEKKILFLKWPNIGVVN